MKNVNIEIFCIAQTRMNRMETRRWLNRVGAEEYPLPIVKDTEATKAEVTDAGAVCGLCAKRCYMSFEPGLNPNVTRVRKDWHDYLTNILSSGHGSVTEHASWTFAIEGISRVLTGELNRHRAGVAISEGSMRYIRFDDIAFWMPNSLQPGNMTLMPKKKCKECRGQGLTGTGSLGLLSGDFQMDKCEVCHGLGKVGTLSILEFETKKEKTRNLFKTGFEQMELNYSKLCDLWGIDGMKAFDTKKKLTSLFRRIIGMGVATGGTWTFNTRALRHVVALRTSSHAEEEIAHVIGLIGKYMVESEPSLFGDFVKDDVTGAWVPKHVKV